MLPCPSCCFPNSEQSRLCGHCGIYLKTIGDYVLTERIGSGGFADVYRAVNRYTGHSAAIKFLHQKLINDREIEQRFLREGEILRGIRSPNVVQIFDFGVLDDLGLYLVMEWLDGESLDVFVQEREQKCLPFTEVVPLFTQLLYGLSHIHEQQVVHRDLKPKNFMVVQEQGQPVLKILDFGIAWVPGGQDLTERGMFVGSTYFMAPEQFKAQKKLFGPSTDLYVAGQLLLWMLTGKHVFTANTLQALAVRHCCEAPPRLSDLRPDLPFCESLERLVSRSLEKKPPGRFPSALEFLDAFKQAIPEQLQLMEQVRGSSSRAARSQSQRRDTPRRSLGQAAPGTPAPASSYQLPIHTPAANAPMAQAPQEYESGRPRMGPSGGGGGAGGGAGGVSQGGVVVLERASSFAPVARPRKRQGPRAQQTSDLPRINGGQQQSLQAPDPRLLLHVDAPLKQTPMHPLKALHNQTSQRDSSPGLGESRPLPTFRRTTSMQSVPSLASPTRQRWWLWGVVLLGCALILAGLYYTPKQLQLRDTPPSPAPARVQPLVRSPSAAVPLIKRRAPRRTRRRRKSRRRLRPR